MGNTIAVVSLFLVGFLSTVFSSTANSQSAEECFFNVCEPESGWEVPTPKPFRSSGLIVVPVHIYITGSGVVGEFGLILDSNEPFGLRIMKNAVLEDQDGNAYYSSATTANQPVHPGKNKGRRFFVEFEGRPSQKTASVAASFIVKGYNNGKRKKWDVFFPRIPVGYDFYPEQ